MKGDTNRDWRVVDWSWTASDFDKRMTVSATVNGWEVRNYEFLVNDIPADAARLFNDMLAALKQHRDRS